MKKGLLPILLCILLSGSLMSCKINNNSDTQSDNSSQSSQSDQSDFDDPAYMNEDDGVELVVAPHGEEDFVGKWTATSEKSKYLYGNIDLNIKDNHTWSGNITGEKLKGKWESDGTSIIIKDSEDLINWNLFFTTDGTLMFNEVEDPDISLVLKPAKGFGS